MEKSGRTHIASGLALSYPTNVLSYLIMFLSIPKSQWKLKVSSASLILNLSIRLTNILVVVFFSKKKKMGY